MIFKAKQWEYLSKCWHLTAREVEVAKLVCEGLDNKQISKKLRIAYNTVRAHLENIFRKVGVKGKAGIILEFVDVLQKAAIPTGVLADAVISVDAFDLVNTVVSAEVFLVLLTNRKDYEHFDRDDFLVRSS